MRSVELPLAPPRRVLTSSTADSVGAYADDLPRLCDSCPRRTLPEFDPFVPIMAGRAEARFACSRIRARKASCRRRMSASVSSPVSPCPVLGLRRVGRSSNFGAGLRATAPPARACAGADPQDLPPREPRLAAGNGIRPRHRGLAPAARRRHFRVLLLATAACRPLAETCVPRPAKIAWQDFPIASRRSPARVRRANSVDHHIHATPSGGEAFRLSL